MCLYSDCHLEMDDLLTFAKRLFASNPKDRERKNDSFITLALRLFACIKYPELLFLFIHRFVHTDSFGDEKRLCITAIL